MGRHVSADVNKDVVTKVKGSIQCEYKKALKHIEKNLDINPSKTISLTTLKGTKKLNLLEGGKYDAGYVAGLAHFATYKVQEGTVIPIFADNATGEEKKFIAREPVKLELDWKIFIDYNPEISEPENDY